METDLIDDSLKSDILTYLKIRERKTMTFKKTSPQLEHRVKLLLVTLKNLNLNFTKLNFFHLFWLGGTQKKMLIRWYLLEKR